MLRDMVQMCGQKLCGGRPSNFISRWVHIHRYWKIEVGVQPPTPVNANVNLARKPSGPHSPADANQSPRREGTPVTIFATDLYESIRCRPTGARIPCNVRKTDTFFNMELS